MDRDNVTPFRKRRPPKQVRQGPPLSTHRGKAVAAEALALILGLFQALPIAPVLMSFAPPLHPTAIFLNSIMPPQLALSLLSFGAAAGGFFIALSNRQQAIPWAQTHHEFALRTIIFGVCGSALATMMRFLGPLVLATLPILTLTALWVLVRSLVGLVLAIVRQPMRRPTGWLI